MLALSINISTIKRNLFSRSWQTIFFLFRDSLTLNNYILTIYVLYILLARRENILSQLSCDKPWGHERTHIRLPKVLVNQVNRYYQNKRYPHWVNLIKIPTVLLWFNISRGLAIICIKKQLFIVIYNLNLVAGSTVFAKFV